MGKNTYLLVAAVAGLGLWYYFTHRGPKYKVGDVLRLADDTIETFTVTAIQTVGGVKQYVLQSSRGPNVMPPFALDVSFVDSNPQWTKA